MDGVHDLGGKEGFGAIVREANEPVFHARWESRVFGLNRSVPAVQPGTSITSDTPSNASTPLLT